MIRGDAKNVLYGEDAQAKILSGAEKVYKAVAQVYGPTSGNVAIGKSYGPATVTHDGVTVASSVYLKDENEDIGAGFLVQAAEKTNEISGDGTSATVILGYNIMRLARQRIAAGYDPMAMRRGIDKASVYLKEQIDSLSIPVKDEDLHQVASVSASDPEIGKLVADTVLKVGVGITVEEYAGLGVIQDVVDGMYFEKGWVMPHFVTDRASEEAVHEGCNILVTEKKLRQNQDIVPILENLYKESEYKTLLIVGMVSDQALETCALTNIQGRIKVCVVNPPVYGDQELPFLEDLAAKTGGKLIPNSMPSDKVTSEFLGFADKVIVDKDSTTILGGHGVKENVDSRIEDIKKQLKSDKFNAFQKERLELRLSKLQGKIGIIKVGGATPTEAKEAKFRVEDAIQATRAAREEGIVPGGASTLARLSQENVPELTRHEEQGFAVVLEALQEPFRQLMRNAGEDDGSALKELLKSPQGHGFDVKNPDKTQDLVKAGIIDPTKVIKSVVENACSAAGIAITVPCIITEDREYKLQQVEFNKAFGATG
jgi:chaperonin GroEL